jgi:hypothetical protein
MNFDVFDNTIQLTSIELNGLPLYASVNSTASFGSGNLMTAKERLGTESRIILKCEILDDAGATKLRKSEGVIQEGTARTPSITPTSIVTFSFSVDLAGGDGLMDCPGDD